MRSRKPSLDCKDIRLTRRENQLLTLACEIEKMDFELPEKGGLVGCMSTVFAQISMPHGRQKELYFKRTNGQITVSFRGHELYGCPYGGIPRLILAWICSESAKTKSKELYIGGSVVDFARKIGVSDDSRGIFRLKCQAMALAQSLISIEYKNNNIECFQGLKIVKESIIDWSDKKQKPKWATTIFLTDDFFRAAIENKMPIRMDVYRALSKSPMSQDIYTWLTYRIYVLNKSTRKSVLIPWVLLRLQFGANYSDNDRGIYDFKKNFLIRLNEVIIFYKEAYGCIEDVGDCLKIKATMLHIRQRS